MYDTGIYVDYLRRGERARAIESVTGLGLVHLSVAVAHELIVGAPDRQALRFLEGLVDQFESVGRLAVPSRLDWLLAGRAVREVGRRNGYEKVGRARLTNDALILAAARTYGATVVTRNLGDFRLLGEYFDVHIVEVLPE